MRQRFKTYTFIVAEHTEFGTKGFKPSWYPAGDPLEGMAVAHDILEHFPKDDGSAEGEYQALGAGLWIRGDGGYWSRKWNPDPTDHISVDLPTVWGIQGRVRPCGLVRNEGLLEQCREAVSKAVKELRAMEVEHMPTEEDQENIARWIARGYKRAQKRYRNHGSYNIAERLFRVIEEAADKALTYAEEHMILTVRVDFTNLEAFVDCV